MAGLSWIEIIYWASTIVGGTLFILRVVMMFLGGNVSDDAIDSALDTGGDHLDADISFKLMSVQGLTSFFMMFGLVGLALLKAGLTVFLTVLGGILAGLVTVAITGVVFSQMKRLQTEGTIHIQNTIGTEVLVFF
jgi:hypothetical protein